MKIYTDIHHGVEISYNPVTNLHVSPKVSGSGIGLNLADLFLCYSFYIISTLLVVIVFYAIIRRRRFKLKR